MARNAKKRKKTSKGTEAGPTMSKRDRRAAAQRKAELKRKSSWAVLFVGIALVVGIIGFAIKASVDNANSGVADASRWELPALYGGEHITLASLRGKPVVVNFFASWCVQCEAELPEFRAAVDTYGDQVEFVFVDSQDSDRLGKDMAERHGIDGLTVAKDFGASNASFFRELGGRGMPITAFFGPDGTLRFVQTGALINGALEDAMRQLGFI